MKIENYKEKRKELAQASLEVVSSEELEETAKAECDCKKKEENERDTAGDN